VVVFMQERCGGAERRPQPSEIAQNAKRAVKWAAIRVCPPAEATHFPEHRCAAGSGECRIA